MQVMTSTAIKNHVGDLMDAVQNEPVLITKNKKPVGVFVSIEDIQGTYLEEMLTQKSAEYDEWLKQKLQKASLNAKRGKAVMASEVDDAIMKRIQEKLGR